MVANDRASVFLMSLLKIMSILPYVFCLTRLDFNYFCLNSLSASARFKSNMTWYLSKVMTMNIAQEAKRVGIANANDMASVPTTALLFHKCCFTLGVSMPFLPIHGQLEWRTRFANLYLHMAWDSASHYKTIDICRVIFACIFKTGIICEYTTYKFWYRFG